MMYGDFATRAVKEEQYRDYLRRAEQQLESTPATPAKTTAGSAVKNFWLKLIKTKPAPGLAGHGIKTNT